MDNRFNPAASNPNPNPNPNPNALSLNLANTTHNIDVAFLNHNIRTVVTSDPAQVSIWLSTNATVRRGLMVGLDIEWRPNTGRNMQNPVATLQLCLRGTCLIFQILHSPFIPASLAAFLADPNVTFFGVGIHDDAEKLLRDYSLHVANVSDLRVLAAEKLWRNPDLRHAGLKTLCLRILGVEVQKPEEIRRSPWDNRWLTLEQVQYAAIDAYLSYEIGRQLTMT